MNLLNLNFVQLFITLAQSHQHPAVAGSQLLRLLEVVEAVVVHLQYLISLTQTIPGSVVSSVHLYCLSVGLNGCVGVLHLHVFVSHQRECRQISKFNILRIKWKQPTIAKYPGFSLRALWK